MSRTDVESQLWLHNCKSFENDVTTHQVYGGRKSGIYTITDLPELHKRILDGQLMAEAAYGDRLIKLCFDIDGKDVATREKIIEFAANDWQVLREFLRGRFDTSIHTPHA